MPSAHPNPSALALRGGTDRHMGRSLPWLPCLACCVQSRRIMRAFGTASAVFALLAALAAPAIASHCARCAGGQLSDCMSYCCSKGCDSPYSEIPCGGAGAEATESDIFTIASGGGCAPLTTGECSFQPAVEPSCIAAGLCPSSGCGSGVVATPGPVPPVVTVTTSPTPMPTPMPTSSTPTSSPTCDPAKEGWYTPGTVEVGGRAQAGRGCCRHAADGNVGSRWDGAQRFFSSKRVKINSMNECKSACLAHNAARHRAMDASLPECMSIEWHRPSGRCEFHDSIPETTTTTQNRRSCRDARCRINPAAICEGV